jgi:phosphopantetheinyl transferase (holo-ACP synthase)
MTSAGNDIVSLTAINVTRTKGPEFYSKIISPSEKELYNTLDHQILPFEYFVWLLWSVKEAAFKYLHRLNPKTLFIPVRFVVSQLEIPADWQVISFPGDETTAKGFDGFPVINSVVSHGDNELYAKTIIHKEFISSVVNYTKSFDHVYWGIKRIEDTTNKYQSASVREFAVHNLQSILGVTELIISKNADEVPVLLNAGQGIDLPVSLSHHECWVGYSFLTKRLDNF